LAKFKSRPDLTMKYLRSFNQLQSTRRSTLGCYCHGLCILLSVMFFANYINYVPLGCLAAILLHTGFKLAKPALFMDFYRKGWSKLLPFVITISAILATDLLKGMAIGLIIGLFFVIKANYRAAITMTQNGSSYRLTLN
ncbi:MAG: SulP family inorganic anion transporter, partial [Candidatus Nitrotoga sp.]